MQRSTQINQLQQTQVWDVVIIGGGATGVGAALDAASRGYSTLLLEKFDFGKGTSSKSTKLVHGGVRYLAQGNYKLVKEALKERGLLLKNAPNITKSQAFVLPVFSYWQWFYYAAGLLLYDFLSGKLSLGKTKIFGKHKTIQALPSINPASLVGSIVYYDGQFNDTRLLIDIAKKAIQFKACILNYAEVISFEKNSEQKVSGLQFKDILNNKIYKVPAKTIINATGVFVDALMKLDHATHAPIIAASQGIHLVISKVFFEGTNALMIPKTKDGRVLFAVPWNDVIVVGTTDTPTDKIEAEPTALQHEIDFVLDHFNEYCSTKITLNDVQSVFVGLRPLVKKAKSHTALMSRDHSIIVSESGVVNITGGKWTTYRKMAQDAVDNAVFSGKLEKRNCITQTLQVNNLANENLEYPHLKIYGAEAIVIENFINQNSYHQQKIHQTLPLTVGEVIWIIQNEMPQTIEDVLSRRTRVLFSNTAVAIEIAPIVGELLKAHFNKSQSWVNHQVELFVEVAKKYSL
jgi:glycerol-3-phosphate dehydrogenase